MQILVLVVELDGLNHSGSKGCKEVLTTLPLLASLKKVGVRPGMFFFGLFEIWSF